MRVELRLRDVPVAADHDAAVSPELARSLEHAPLEAPLERVSVAGYAAELVVEVGLVRPVDCVDVPEREAGEVRDDEPPFEVPRRDLAPRRPREVLANVGDDAVEATAAKGHVLGVAVQ